MRRVPSIGGSFAASVAARLRTLGAIAHFDPSWGATDDGTTSTWVDRIGGSAVASTSQATRLVYSSSLAGLNSRPGWTGVAANSTRLVNTASTALGLAMAGAAPHTIYTVRKHSGLGTFQVVFASGKTGVGDFLYVGGNVTTGVSLYSRLTATGPAQTTNTGIIQHTTSEPSIAVATFTGTTSALHDNGGVADASKANVVSLNIQNLCIGALRQNVTFSSFFDGLIGDIIVFPTAHTDAQRRQVEQLLAIKYGWPVLQGLSDFALARYLATANPGGLAGSGTGFGQMLLMRTDLQNALTRTMVSRYTGVGPNGHRILNTNNTQLNFIASSGAPALVTSPNVTIGVNNIGKLLAFGCQHDGSALRSYLSRAEVGSPGTAIAGFTPHSSATFLGTRDAAGGQASETTIFGVAQWSGGISLANMQSYYDGIKTGNGNLPSTVSGASMEHIWQLPVLTDEVGADTLTSTGSLASAQIIMTEWPW